MGGLSFFLQDFPQFTIHACFKIFYVTPTHYALKKELLLLISMFVSGAAVLISLFNLVMCRENDFDPVDLEAALQKRRDEVAERKKQEAIEAEKVKAELARQASNKEEKVHFKRRIQDAFRKKLLQDAENEEATKMIKSNLKSIEEPKKQSKIMNRL